MEKDNNNQNAGSGNSQDNNNPEEKQGKLFTQDEVNAIIKTRLERVKVDQAALDDIAEREQQLEQKQAELAKRETAIDCRTYLQDKGYSIDLIDILDTSDIETFKAKADKIAGLMQKSNIAPLGSSEPRITNSMPDAFSLGHKHKPRGLPGE